MTGGWWIDCGDFILYVEMEEAKCCMKKHQANQPPVITNQTDHR